MKARNSRNRCRGTVFWLYQSIRGEEMTALVEKKKSVSHDSRTSFQVGNHKWELAKEFIVQSGIECKINNNTGWKEHTDKVGDD